MLIDYLWSYGGFGFATVVCAAACLWGGTTERAAGATLWIAWALSMAVGASGYKGPGNPVILIDTVVLVVFVGLSLRSRHIWLLLATASQLDDVASHFAARLMHFGRFSYLIATGIWGGLFITLCLAAGTLGYRQRRRRQIAAAASQDPTPQARDIEPRSPSRRRDR